MKPKPSTTPLTPPQAAVVWGVSSATAKRWILSGRVAAQKLNARCQLIDAIEVERIKREIDKQKGN